MVKLMQLKSILFTRGERNCFSLVRSSDYLRLEADLEKPIRVTRWSAFWALALRYVPDSGNGQATAGTGPGPLIDKWRRRSQWTRNYGHDQQIADLQSSAPMTANIELDF
jgi:hypothetical protein